MIDRNSSTPTKVTPLTKSEVDAFARRLIASCGGDQLAHEVADDLRQLSVHFPS